MTSRRSVALDALAWRRADARTVSLISEALRKAEATVKPKVEKRDTGLTLVKREAKFLKASADELRLAWYEVYVPNDIDTHGDFMSAEEIRRMAHRFIPKIIARGDLGIDVDHDNVPGRAEPVDTFWVDPTWKQQEWTPGAWVIAIHFLDDELWSSVKSGERASVSFQAWVRKRPVRREVLASATVTIKTEDASGHEHTARCVLDERGNVVSGETDTIDGHKHQISSNVRTEIGGSPAHRHTMSIARAVLADEEASHAA